MWKTVKSRKSSLKYITCNVQLSHLYECKKNQILHLGKNENKGRCWDYFMERFVKYAERFSSQAYFYKMFLLTEGYWRHSGARRKFLHSRGFLINWSDHLFFSQTLTELLMRFSPLPYNPGQTIQPPCCQGREREEAKDHKIPVNTEVMRSVCKL